MRRFTISGAGLIMECRFPYRADVVMPQQVATEGTALGSSVHDCSAKFINTKEATELLDPAVNPVWASARAWIVANWRQTWVAEPAYAWSPVLDYAVQLGVDIGRKYAEHGASDGQVCGTLDILSIEGDCAYVYELGTGHDVGHKFHQMRLQCAVAALANGCTRAVGQVVRFDTEGAYPSPPVEFDEFALAAIRGEFAEYLSEVEGSEPKPGDHCQRCNLAPVCPAAAGIVQALLPAEALVAHRWGLTISSPDHAAWLLAHARLVAAAAEAVKDQVKAYVPDGGLVLEDGSLLVEGERRMPRTDWKKMQALAVALGATPEQIESCSYVAIESAGLKVKKPAASKKQPDADPGRDRETHRALLVGARHPPAATRSGCGRDVALPAGGRRGATHARAGATRAAARLGADVTRRDTAEDQDALALVVLVDRKQTASMYLAPATCLYQVERLARFIDKETAIAVHFGHSEKLWEGRGTR